MNKSILLIPRLQIHNANALSSPHTIGFPAMTAWLGAVHALQRKLQLFDKFNNDHDELEFLSVAVVCHQINLHTHKGASDYTYSIIGTGNPLDKTGKRPSFIEEARCDLVVSLLIEYETDDDGMLEDHVNDLLQGHMKMAGGDIIKCPPVERRQLNDHADLKALMGRVMPGHCLIERRDLMKQAMETGMDAIDALLEYLKVTHKCEVDKSNNVTWVASRKEKGWIVPIATGFHGISEPGFAEHQRDSNTPHRFAESIVTLGEFVMPYRIDDIDNILWRYHTDLEQNLYLCQQCKPFNQY